jgi:hypothetical protein
MTPVLVVSFLACVAIGLLVSGTLRWRRSPVMGVALLATGIGLAGVTTLRVWPALTDGSSLAEAARLNVLLSQAKAQLTAIEHDKTQLTTTVRLRDEQNSQLEAGHRVALDRIEREVLDVHQRFREPGRDVVLETPRRIQVATATGSLDRVDAIAADVADLQRLSARRVPPTPEVVGRQDTTRDLVRLRDRLGTAIKTENYDVEPYPARELVGGRMGKYYAVDLKNAANGIRYFFEGGKYTLRTGQAEFRTSLNAFIGDVLKKVDGNARYDLFVRGSADAKPYEGRLEAGAEIRQVSYLRQVGADRYASEPADMTVGTVVRNTNLPNLRAAFMRDLVTSTYPIKPPLVLEGTVTPKTDDRDRNVELILFIDW